LGLKGFVVVVVVKGRGVKVKGYVGGVRVVFYNSS